jgi:N-acetylmuramoyl-L-alanine amidase
MVARIIAIDDGHGMETSGKRTPTGGITSPETGKNFMHENEFNRAVAKYLKVELERCGFKTVMVAPTDADTPLSTRVATANNAKANFYISIHANANTGKWGTWGGAETLTYGSGESLRIGKIIHKHMMKGTPMRDRGVKDGSWLYVVKNTRMPAVLIEAGFMDNLQEAKLLISDAFRRETAREIAMAICEGFGVKYVAPTVSKPVTTTPQPSGTIYRVRLHWSDAKTQKGAFANLQNAKELADSLKGQGDYRVFDEKGNVVYDPTPEKQDDVWYRVRKTWADAKSQIGAFHELDGAKELADSKTGYKVFDENGKVVYEPKVEAPKEQLYRVRKTWADAKSQKGAFKELNSAKELADANAKDGYEVYDENGKVVYTPKVETPMPTPTPEPTKPVEPTPQPTPIPEPTPAPVDPHEGHTDICGKSVVEAKKMVAFVKDKNPNVQDIEAIANAFITVGEKYGIRGDIAFCQSIIETGWFKFDGGTAVTPDQHNYCGLGVVSKGVKGNAFETVEDGVTAQIQHLFAYACKTPVPNGEFVIDPRFKYVTRGIAPHWEDLSNRWAMNANYGKHILDLYKQLVEFEYVPVEEPIEEAPAPVEEAPVETPEQSEDEQIEKQLSMWKKIVDYVFAKIAEMFGKK